MNGRGRPDPWITRRVVGAARRRGLHLGEPGIELADPEAKLTADPEAKLTADPEPTRAAALAAQAVGV